VLDLVHTGNSELDADKDADAAYVICKAGIEETPRDLRNACNPIVRVSTVIAQSVLFIEVRVDIEWAICRQFVVSKCLDNSIGLALCLRFSSPSSRSSLFPTAFIIAIGPKTPPPST
jgi:hypothetical protein